MSDKRTKLHIRKPGGRMMITGKRKTSNWDKNEHKTPQMRLRERMQREWD